MKDGPKEPTAPASALDELPRRISAALEAKLAFLPPGRRNDIVSTVDSIVRAEIALARAAP